MKKLLQVRLIYKRHVHFLCDILKEWLSFLLISLGVHCAESVISFLWWGDDSTTSIRIRSLILIPLSYATLLCSIFLTIFWKM